MLEGLQQLLATALGRPASIGPHCHQHDRLPRLHPADAVVYQHRQGAVAAGGIARQALWAQLLRLPLF